ncbi:MAG: hypothetical protein CV088_03405 [Nitrospira sp. LK70]|nr:hypothetical protein [Nitrospira sp. LK70]
MNKKCVWIITVFAMVHVSIGAAQAADADVSEDEFLETIMKISGDKRVKIEEGTARFIDNDGEWSIFGATQKNAVSYERPATWSLLPNKTHELLIVDDPISDTHILPFSDPVPNVRPGNDLALVAARGEVESGSFVLRSGSNPLRRVTVEVDDLISISGQEQIEATSIDVSVVKCWFQAGGTIDRTVGGTKRLVPELLLHNPELVQVDYEHQVNLVKNLPSIEDSERLVVFDQPKQFNQQFWITLHVPKQALPGFYTSKVRLSFDVSSRRETQQFTLQLQVLPFELPEPIIDYAMFYKGQLNSLAATQVSIYNKSPGQMLAEFRDMREHGLTNVAIEDDISSTGPTANSIKKMKQTVALMREAGFNNTRMLYVDWELWASDNRSHYTRKLRDLLTIAKQKGFNELFAYNRDEQEAEALLKGRLSFETAHAEGVKNFVATSGKSILKLAGLLDVIVLRRKDWRDTDLARQVGMESWAYADPQGGEERPFTYRSIYGVRLWAEGFDGACEYTYQSATRKERTGWNDWGHDRWRPHTMSYATRTRPIRTLQWEGWREGVDDVRYLTMLLKFDPLPGRNGAESRNAYLRMAVGIERNAHPSIMRRKVAERIVLSINRN